MSDRADTLDKIERWLHAHEAIEATQVVGIKRPRVVLDDFKTFQRLFGGNPAEADDRDGWTDWKIEQDGILFSCTQYHTPTRSSLGRQAIVPTLAENVPAQV